MKVIKTIQLSILAGMSISLGGIVNLQAGGVIGAVLFTFGLLTCVHFRLPLYTGTAGFVNSYSELKQLGIILLGNILGCLITAWLAAFSIADLADKVAPIVEKRDHLQFFQTVILATFCGFVMTVAVKFGRNKLFLPLIFGVPLFILSGFIHSIADAFYLCIDFRANTGNVYGNYIAAVIGNFIGCNLYRFVALVRNYPEDMCKS